MGTSARRAVVCSVQINAADFPNCASGGKLTQKGGAPRGYPGAGTREGASGERAQCVGVGDGPVVGVGDGAVVGVGDGAVVGVGEGAVVGVGDGAVVGVAVGPGDVVGGPLARFTTYNVTTAPFAMG